jgi:hypothetical protein
VRELQPARQVPGEPRRRWFASNNCDLIVWLGDDGKPIGFQFCYDKQLWEHALTWNAPDVFMHTSIDAGGGDALHHKGSPILAADGVFDGSHVSGLFEKESADVPKDYRDLVLGKIREYENRQKRA